LRAAASYPAAEGAFADADLQSALIDCGLAAFADNLDESDHWARRLSPGEQQRVAFARVLLHKPDWLFLDEATSALDPETEERLYRLLRERLPGITVLSIGHRLSLVAFHSRRVAVRRDGAGIGRLEEVAV